jgi:hypothetical protein
MLDMLVVQTRIGIANIIAMFTCEATASTIAMATGGVKMIR